MWSTITFLCHTVICRADVTRLLLETAHLATDVSCVLHIHRLFTVTSKCTYRTEISPTLLRIKSLSMSSTTVEMWTPSHPQQLILHLKCSSCTMASSSRWEKGTWIIVGIDGWHWQIFHQLRVMETESHSCGVDIKSDELAMCLHCPCNMSYLCLWAGLESASSSTEECKERFFHLRIKNKRLILMKPSCYSKVMRNLLGVLKFSPRLYPYAASLGLFSLWLTFADNSSQQFKTTITPLLLICYITLYTSNFFAQPSLSHCFIFNTCERWRWNQSEVDNRDPVVTVQEFSTTRHQMLRSCSASRRDTASCSLTSPIRCYF